MRCQPLDHKFTYLKAVLAPSFTRRDGSEGDHCPIQRCNRAREGFPTFVYSLLGGLQNVFSFDPKKKKTPGGPSQRDANKPIMKHISLSSPFLSFVAMPKDT